jgi:hypothetical protein
MLLMMNNKADAIKSMGVVLFSFLCYTQDFEFE